MLCWLDSERAGIYHLHSVGWKYEGSACSNCVRVCPFNKPPGWLHDSARFLVRNAPWLDSSLLRLDKLLGYGKRMKAEDFWASLDS